MQRLMILRHAKAVPWGSTPNDFSRPLNDIGNAHAEAVAHWIDASLDFPDVVLCSPSQRTRETLAPIIDSRTPREQRTRFLPQLYGATFGTLINILDHAFAEHDSVLLVGHNPGLEHLVFETVARSGQAGFKRLATGTLVVVGLDPDWAEAQGQGQIEHIVRGKKLLA